MLSSFGPPSLGLCPCCPPFISWKVNAIWLQITPQFLPGHPPLMTFVHVPDFFRCSIISFSSFLNFAVTSNISFLHISECFPARLGSFVPTCPTREVDDSKTKPNFTKLPLEHVKEQIQYVTYSICRAYRAGLSSLDDYSSTPSSRRKLL